MTGGVLSQMMASAHCAGIDSIQCCSGILQMSVIKNLISKLVDVEFKIKKVFMYQNVSYFA